MTMELDRMSCAPPAQHSLDVCPHCKRGLAVISRVECDGHSFPVIWNCPEHGEVPPMRSAIVNYYSPPDWSAA